MPDDVISLEERKKELIARGAAYRARVIEAKSAAHAGLRPDALAKGALDHMAATASAAFRNGEAARIAAESLPMVLPLLMSGVSALSRRSLLKPVLRGAAIAAVTAGLAMLVFKKKKRKDGSNNARTASG